MMAFYNFCQNFGQVLGVTLGGIILQNDLPQRLSAKLSSEIDVGGDAAYSLIPLIPTLSPTEQMEVKSAITGSLRMIWVASAVISGVGMLISLFVRTFSFFVQTEAQLLIGACVIPVWTDAPSATGLRDRRALWREGRVARNSTSILSNLDSRVNGIF